MNYISSLDHSLFLFFNDTISNSLFDIIMPIITNSNNILISTLSAMLIFTIFYKDKKQALIIVGLALVLFATTDSISYRVLKPMFHRLRPCNPKYFVDGVHQFLGSGHFLMGFKGSYSLPSNHSVNMFGQAVFWLLLFPKKKWLFLIIATTVAYSRVYVGVHYPFDVLFGAIVGGLFGYLFYTIFRKTIKIKTEVAEVVE